MIRCLAVDDEPLALKQLEYYLKNVPFFTVVACCHSAVEAFKVINEDDIDVIFTDIHMPDLNGLDFIKSVPNPPMVVFTTADQEYALAGYEVNAIGYLLKPFGQKEVLGVAEKVKRQYELLHSDSVSPVDEDDAIFLHAEYKIVRIVVKEIICVEGYGEYLRIRLSSHEKPFMAYLSMKKMEERLCSCGFMRIHKSYIINLRHIFEINKNRVVLDSGAEIPIGESYRETLNKYIASKFLSK